MNKPVAAVVMILALAPVGALAQERGGDAALGALSGAVVLGPVGAVAGALIGYTAGPSIASSWGLRHSRSAKYRNRASRDPGLSSRAAAPSRSGEAGNGRVAQNATAATSSSAQNTASPPGNASMPPAQGFE
jgi:hypothetical protein